MVPITETTASEVKEALRKEGISVTFKKLSEVFDMPVNGTVELPGTLDEIKARIFAAETDSSPVTPSSEEAIPVTKAPAKRAEKTALASQITTSNRPPRITRTPEGEKAAGELMNLLQQWPVPEAFPSDLARFRRSGVAMIRATTVDGEVCEVTQTEALKSLERRDDLSFAIPLFSRKAENKIVTAVSYLDGAPQPDARDENGLRIFGNRNAWYFNLLQIGIRIWAGNNNPPSLDLDEFPHRRFMPDGVTPIEDIVFRYRPIMLGFVAKVQEAFEDESINCGLTGTALREFRADWVNQFVKKERTVTIGGVVKSFADFRGKKEEFLVIWEIVKTQATEREKALTKKAAPTHRRSRKGS